MIGYQAVEALAKRVVDGDADRTITGARGISPTAITRRVGYPLPQPYSSSNSSSSLTLLLDSCRCGAALPTPSDPVTSGARVA
jgi:hypothetical protein